MSSNKRRLSHLEDTGACKAAWIYVRIKLLCDEQSAFMCMWVVNEAVTVVLISYGFYYHSLHGPVKAHALGFIVA